MACLDAAARFTPKLTLAMTAVNRERATAAGFTTLVASSVMDRENAAVGTRSEFSMVSGKPVQSFSDVD
jgi:hypothetical protein